MSRPRRQVHKRRAGVALILALLFVVVLTVIVVEFAYETQVEASFATNMGSDLESYLAARSGVASGIAMLAEDQLQTELNGEPLYDSYLDPVPWAMGIPFEPMNEAISRAGIADEYGKLNLNALLDTSEEPPVENEAMVSALREFFLARSPEVNAPALVDSTLDWLDYADGEEVRAEGAENEYYLGLENPYPCKNGPLDNVEELLLIKGMTIELYYGDPEVEPPILPLPYYLTVHGDYDGRINPNTAEPETIAAVIAGYTGDYDIGGAEQIVEQARNMQPFMNPSELGSFVPQLGDAEQARRRQQRVQPGVAQPELRPQEQVTAETVFTTTSNVFRIYGDGMLEDVLVRIEAYVWRTPLGGVAPPVQNQQGLPNAGGAVAPPVAEPFRILSWKVIR